MAEYVTAEGTLWSGDGVEGLLRQRGALEARISELESELKAARAAATCERMTAQGMRIAAVNAEREQSNAESALADCERERDEAKRTFPFAGAWSAAVECGLVDEFAEDLDGEENKLRVFLAQLGGVAGPASAAKATADAGDDREPGLPDSPSGWESGAPDPTGICLGCGMTVGKPHRDACPYRRSRRVNTLQTRIAPVLAARQARAGEDSDG